jgi:hypothetical protein
MIIKTILLGDKAVGKSHFLQSIQPIGVARTSMYIPTIGINLISYSKSGTTIQVWDTSGADRFKGVVRTFLRGVSLCTLVYNSKRSFQKLLSYIEQVEQLCARDYRIIVVCLGTNPDVVEVGETFADTNKYCFYQCNPYDRSNAIQTWHNIMHMCEDEVYDTKWSVDRHIPVVLSQSEPNWWDKICIWRSK